MDLFSAWQQGHGFVGSRAELLVKLDEIGQAARRAPNATDRAAEGAKLKWLREQIEMRVLGFGWTHHRTFWSSTNDETVGTVDALVGSLCDIITEEIAAKRLNELPTAAQPPPCRVRTMKQLGTPCIDAQQLASKVCARHADAHRHAPHASHAAASADASVRAACPHARIQPPDVLLTRHHAVPRLGRAYLARSSCGSSLASGWSRWRSTARSTRTSGRSRR